ncbi:MAG: O-antigen polymerase family protein [Microgenomates group bacterium GW2011_GWA2_47_8]|nr:MAG: O-antigen polymerase family protein [Microgenomates group bacterium GW2011_GWA2_47_8]
MKWHQRFFWLLLLFLPTQLGLHFWPDWAGVLGRRVDYLAPTVYLTDILALFTVGIYSISNIQYPISKKKFLFFIPIVLFVVLNIAVSTNHFVAIYKWLKVLEFVALGWYIVKTKPKLSAISFPLAAGVFYSSVLAIVQFFLQHSVGGPLWWLGERTFDVGTPGIARVSLCQWVSVSWTGCPELLRPYATFPHPNVLGGFLAAVLPFIVVSTCQRVSESVKKYFSITFFVGIIALGLTFSRSAILVGGIGILFAFRNKFLSAFVVTSVLVFFIFNSQFSILNSQDESVVVRQQLNVAAVKLWSASPLFGVGLGNFLVRLPEALPTRTIYFLQPVHNIYLLLLAEVGVVGVVGVLWVVWGIIRKQKNDYRLSLIAILLLGLLDHYPLTLQQGQLLLTVLAGMSLTFVH